MFVGGGGLSPNNPPASYAPSIKNVLYIQFTLNTHSMVCFLSVLWYTCILNKYLLTLSLIFHCVDFFSYAFLLFLGFFCNLHRIILYWIIIVFIWMRILPFLCILIFPIFFFLGLLFFLALSARFFYFYAYTK